MARSDRRYDGAPHYDLERVQQLARGRFMHITGKALKVDAPRVLPRSLLDVSGAIRATVLALKQSEWRFCQQNENGWADIYRIARYQRVLWVKIKIELRGTTDHTIVISFHDWDDARQN